MATIADTIRAALSQGLNNEQVLKAVKAAHPDSNTSAACVSYYRSKMKKAGAATAKPQAKPKAEQKPVAAAVAASVGVYEVRGIKTFVGMEGHGYNATLYRDGKAVCFIIDDASGGPVTFEWKDHAAPKVEADSFNYKDEPVKAKVTPEEALFLAVVNALPPCTMFDKPMRVNMEMYAEELVNDAQLVKEVQRMMKGKIAFIKRSGELFTAKAEPNEKNIAIIKAKHEGCIVLNELSLLAAVAAVKAMK